MTARPALISETDLDEIRAKLRSDAAMYERRLADLDHDDAGAQDHATARAVRQSLSEIQAAMLRVDTPEYGYCDECGRWIAVARLLALPHTRHCIECAANR